jgi:hypothetical protein
MQNPSIFSLSTLFNNRNPEKLQIGAKDIKTTDNKQWTFQKKMLFYSLLSPARQHFAAIIVIG